MKNTQFENIGLSKLPPKLEWLRIESEPHEVVNDNLVRYPLKNKWVIEVSLNLVSYDRNVRVLDVDGKEFRSYSDLSFDEIVSEIRKYESE